MENSLGKIISLLVLAVMVFIVPVEYYMAQSEALGDMYLISRTTEIVDAVRNTGFITKDMYEQYMRQVNQVNKDYKVELTHGRYGYINYEKIEEKWYTQQLIEKIYDEGVYKFDKEDYFKIQIVSDNRLIGRQMIAYYGGYVRNEAY